MQVKGKRNKTETKEKIINDLQLQARHAVGDVPRSRILNEVK